MSETQEGYVTCWIKNLGLPKSKALPLHGNIFVVCNVFFVLISLFPGIQMLVTSAESPSLFSYHLLFLLVLVCSDYCNKTPQAEWLNKQEFLFSLSWRLEVQD